MLYNVYSVRDVHTGFLSPTYEVNDNAAKRNFAHAVNQPDSLLYSHAKDYSLYFVGQYDTDTGNLVPASPVRVVCEASSLLEVQ